ncbi:FAD-dependent oxidoreductase [Opitutus sp. ER46]|uniref:FAD-dependent oxidoreductase n=1 Tax=Opitutus sp. ER46 TaxID=2161864 RepID=UPI000D2F9EE6|nr:FAD-dependent oxidoreductase [Opitutus sp. ER46]PTX98639.1 FAD-dependent oxidoreductase [Opitutus sp. ER46]
MSEHAGQTTSLWMQTASRPEFTELSAPAAADVCIVGAGISGLTTAYFLTRAGRSVIVLDDGPIVSGETERTTAHLSFALDDRYTELERIHGAANARLAAESHLNAIGFIERIIREEAIDCDFTRLDGYLFNAPDMPADLLDQELEAAHRAGLSEVELVERAPLVSFNTGPALLFPHQGQFHPLKYLGAMARAIVREGGQIYAHTHAAEIEGGKDAHVRTADGHRIACGSVVVATNSPVNDRFAIHTKQAPYRTYVVGFTVPVGTVPQVLYWDTGDPYHYVRLQPAAPGDPYPARDILVVGGEDHKTGQAEDPAQRFARLEEWTRHRFPMVQEVRHRWSGQVMEPLDGLAFIGRNPMDADNVYIATGDSGHGMTHGTIAGRLISDLILGRENRWADLYSPSRVPTGATREFLRENANVAAQYLDWLTAGEAERNLLIPPGKGAIVRHGLTKVAVYRDPDGTYHECSAVCPHLRAIVDWNDVEKTWDCPAHGSRFDALGHVLNGPANEDLRPLALNHERARE